MVVSRELRNPVETKTSRRDTAIGRRWQQWRPEPRGVGSREKTAAFIYTQGKEDGGEEGGGRRRRRRGGGEERQSRGVLHVSLQRGVDPK